MIKFELVNQLRGKGRHRVSTKNGFVRAYTPKETEDYEKLIKYAFLNEVLNTNNKGYFNGQPLSVGIYPVKAVPKGTTKKYRIKMLNNEILPTKKPDADNIIKIVLDALNKVAYGDDKQVIGLEYLKLYGEEEKVVIVIKEFELEDIERLTKLCK